MKKYCVACARWFGTLREVENDCPIHSGLPKRYFVTLKEMRDEFKNKIRDLKFKKEKINESLKFHKETLKLIDKRYNI